MTQESLLGFVLTSVSSWIKGIKESNSKVRQSAGLFASPHLFIALVCVDMYLHITH